MTHHYQQLSTDAAARADALESPNAHLMYTPAMIGMADTYRRQARIFSRAQYHSDRLNEHDHNDGSLIQ